MPRSGSSAMTRAPVAASGRVSLPVPAAMSVTRVPGASRSCSVRKSTAAAGSSAGRARRPPTRNRSRGRRGACHGSRPQHSGRRSRGATAAAVAHRSRRKPAAATVRRRRFLGAVLCRGVLAVGERQPHVHVVVPGRHVGPLHREGARSVGAVQRPGARPGEPARVGPHFQRAIRAGRRNPHVDAKRCRSAGDMGRREDGWSRHPSRAGCRRQTDPQ